MVPTLRAGLRPGFISWQGLRFSFSPQHLDLPSGGYQGQFFRE